MAIGAPRSYSQCKYKPAPMRPLDAIRADILALERDSEGLLTEIIGS